MIEPTNLQIVAYLLAILNFLLWLIVAIVVFDKKTNYKEY